ncbi:hypothetical protein RB195_004317 [Necator americanus]|uniref:SCP domain-containing protein n=1 Tax=Necator americanus TaxID=51031 RepID=A0ABR1BLI3_NECAM
MTKEARQKFLEMHNSLRSSVALGEAKDGAGGNAPKAAKMKKMKYDCKVEKTAMKNAKQCVFKHSQPNQRKGLGENIFMSSDSDMDKAQAAEQATNAWFGELAEKGVGQNLKLTEDLFSRGVGHYTQYSSDTFVLRDPHGPAAREGDEVRGQFRGFQVGPGQAKSGVLLSRPHGNKNHLMVYARFYGIRSSVALGQAKDGAGGNAPKAAKMKTMAYDCEVEKTAMNNAKQCVFKHSQPNQRKGLGENIFMSSDSGMDKAKAAEQASKAWFGELAEKGVGQNLKLTGGLFSRGVGHYTQMVWQETVKLGCYVEACSNMCYVVCQYGPAYLLPRPGKRPLVKVKEKAIGKSFGWSYTNDYGSIPPCRNPQAFPGSCGNNVCEHHISGNNVIAQVLNLCCYGAAANNSGDIFEGHCSKNFGRIIGILHGSNSWLL